MSAQTKPRAAATGRGHANTSTKQPADCTPLCPRQARALAALLQGPASREQLDRLAGCSNAPDLVAGLRRRGLAVPCEKIRVIDRDGRACWPGVYHLTQADREAIARWQAGGWHG